MTTTAIPPADTAGPADAPRPQRRKRILSARLRSTALLSYLMLIALAIIYIYPFLISVATSFKSDAEASVNPLTLVPETITFAAYERLFTDVPLPMWTMNTMFITVVVTLGRVFFDSLAGYALSRLQFRGRTVVFAVFIAVMSVPGVVLLIPRFLILKQLGLYDSFAGMIIPLLTDRRGDLHHEAVLRLDPGERRGGGPHRWSERVPHILDNRSADGETGTHDPVHPEFSGFVERVRPFHRVAAEP